MAKLIIANWKLNPATAGEAKALAKASDVDGLVVCPPFPFLEEVKDKLTHAALGAQDMFWEESGAYTGEVSGAQLYGLGVTHVILGHSERRQNLGETDEMVAKKIAVAIEIGLTPILCVGETKEEHDAGQAVEVVKREIQIGLSKVKNDLSEVTVAYEPIWAIGTGIPDNPDNTVTMVQLIQEAAGAKVPVLYGGSVKPGNAEAFLSRAEIGGALVGGASLRGEDITQIVAIAKKYR